MRRLLFPLSCLALVAACKDGPPPPDRGAAPTAVSAPVPKAIPEATASASVAPTAPAAPSLKGDWQGSYEAKKGTVELPPRVKDSALAKDDGSVASGSGTMTLAIDADGGVSGASDGALGDLVIHGRAEEQTVKSAPPSTDAPSADAGDAGETRTIHIVRTTITPKDPAAPHAMTGVFIGMLKDDAIEGTIRVAGPDATMVRAAEIRLTRREAAK